MSIERVLLVSAPCGKRKFGAAASGTFRVCYSGIRGVVILYKELWLTITAVEVQ